MRLPALILALCCLAGAAIADQYPSKPVRVVVAAPPGGLTDIVARSVSQFLHEKLGQPFIVENIAGASSTIGAVQVQRSAPDGYTLLVNPSLFVITPMLMKVQYDVEKDFTPISNFGTVPVSIGINPEIPAKNIQEFIALAKANPDKFTWGAEGVGSVGHLTMERLQREANFKILIVHYKGTSPALIGFNPSTGDEIHSSRQLQGTLPKGLVRAITGTVTWAGLILLIPFALVAARKRDWEAFGLLLAAAAAIVANAALAGALSDVHDRYQSRVVWIVPFVEALLIWRWSRKAATAQAAGKVSGKKAPQNTAADSAK